MTADGTGDANPDKFSTALRREFAFLMAISIAL
jgi:hypothetical protein